LPLAYYYPSGPAGEVFRKVVGRKPEARRVGVVGLGAGALAYYARADQEWTFYEIDPAVVRLACDWGLFAFWQESRCPPGQRQVRLGDARLALRDEPADVRFDVLVLDAFSSDAVPLHLLTREAMSEYARRLAPGGVVLVHVSNRYLDLAPVVARLGASIEPPLRAWGRFDPTTDPPGRAPSHWVVLARDAADLAPLTTGPSLWDPVPPVGPLWTDRQAALWLAFKWEWRGD
jgi:SAM-dependent methyltransferase